MTRWHAAGVRLLRWPLWQCGFRPFFLAAAAAALYIPLWLLMLVGWLPAPSFPAGGIGWHAHELVFGFALAAVLGFALTAIPEFTDTPAFGRRLTLGLFVLWGSARVVVWLVPAIGLWPLALLQAALCVALLTVLTPPVWRDRSRRQLDLWAALAALLLIAAVASIDLPLQSRVFADPLTALRLLVHLMMLLIVLTQARISMRVVNRELEALGAAADFLARPPRRQVAATMIMLHATAASTGADGAAGWLGLGAGAACLGLLSDWPHGRVLLRRWVALLYALPWPLGIGYGLDGAARLGAPLPPSAGLHVLAVGALGLAIFAVLCIAGRTHAGLPLDERRWLPWAAAALLLATLLRALVGVIEVAPQTLWLAAGVLWSSAFIAWIVRIGPVLWQRRSDGRHGCAGPPAVP